MDALFFCFLLLLLLFVVIFAAAAAVSSTRERRRRKEGVGEVDLFQHVPNHQRVRLLRRIARVSLAHNLQPHPCVGVRRFEGGDVPVGEVVGIVGQHADKRSARVGEPVGKGCLGSLEAVEAGRHAENQMRVLAVAVGVGRRDAEFDDVTGDWSDVLVAEIVDVKEGGVCDKGGGGVGDCVSVDVCLELWFDTPSRVFDFTGEA